MRAERGFKNPVVFGMVVHAFVFVALLAATILIAQNLARNAVVLIIAITVPATVIIVVSLGVTAGALKQRTRHRLVVAKDPGAIVVPAEWSSAVLAPFLRDTSMTASNYRGFGVEIAANSAGLNFWRSRRTTEIELLGRLDWSQVASIEAGTVKAVIGGRIASTIRIALHGRADSPFTDEIELIVRQIPSKQAIAELQQAKHGQPMA